MPVGVLGKAAQSQKLDLYFPLRGREIPVDHGYSLYAALSRLLEDATDPWLHESDAIGIHLVRGRYIGNGRLGLDPRGARLGLRLPVELIPKVLVLAGKALQIEGHTLQLGIPQPYTLKPAESLYAHLVTTRNGQDGLRFDEEVKQQLDALGIGAVAERGERRVFRVRDRKVVGHSLSVRGLQEQDSLRLQEVGLGGRRKMGCGLFLPH